MWFDSRTYLRSYHDVRPHFAYIAWLISFCPLLSFLTVMRHRALLVQENRVSAYQTIADLENCKIPDEDICFVQGDYTELFWNSVLKQK